MKGLFVPNGGTPLTRWKALGRSSTCPSLLYILISTAILATMVRFLDSKPIVIISGNQTSQDTQF